MRDERRGPRRDRDQDGQVPARPRRGSGRGSSQAAGLDWGAVDDDEEEQAPRRRARSTREEEDEAGEAPLPRRRVVRAKPTLMDLCTPVFACAALLPREGGSSVHPAYEAFRGQVLDALRRIESEGPEHGHDPADAAEAVYALCMFLDEQVLESQWNAKERWAAEPLHLTLQSDPEGGINFFRRMEELGPRRGAVKEVYLACLAMGFRGRYAELDPATSATQLADLRQKALRTLLPAPLDKEPTLFPDGYQEAEPIAQQGPPLPRWWLGVSLAILALALIVYVILFVAAGRLPRRAEQVVAPLAGAVLAVRPRSGRP
ncbi:MAG: DotU/TssL family secretion system protein [Acidobacteria bacterium]|nr:DotU/TssL family secretion system protein [Acidobacteriota bacterium]